jgi:hypothetical protein
MGANTSKNSTNQVVKDNVVNRTAVDILNKNIFNASVSTLVNNAQECSNSTDLNAECDVKDSTFDGDFTLDSSQVNKAKINFSCVQESKAAADMSTSMMQELTSQLKTMNGADLDSVMKAATESQQKTGAATLGYSGSSNKTNMDKETNITNEVTSNVESVFEQNLNNNFTQETVSKCINKTEASLSTNVEGVKARNANIKCNQTNDIEAISNCKQLADAVSKTVNETINKLGLEVEAENVAKSKTSAESTTKSEQINTGLLQDAGGLVGAFTGLFAAYGLATAAPFIGACCLCCCCIIIIMVIVMAGAKSMGSSGEGGEEVEGQGGQFGGGFYSKSIDITSSDSVYMFSSIK